VTSHSTTLSDYWHFFAGFLRKPWTVGAVAPSSSQLSQAILETCNLQTARTVVELGAGTGAITHSILQRIGPHTTFIALEVDEQHVQRLRNRFPRVNVCHESAENLRACLARHGCASADCIICGLPWGNMSRPVQDRIMQEVLGALKPGGKFCGFAYLHASWYPTSRAFRQYLLDHFARVHFSPVVWRNLPPAFAYSCPRR
jgi:phospholipid N-methyltransferase